MLLDLKLDPGIFTNLSARSEVNRWKDCDHVRWKDGLPEKLNGWTYRALTGAQTVTYNSTGDTTTPVMVAGTAGQILGKARAIHDWISLDGFKWIAIGTHWKLYLTNNYVLYDITPIQSSGVLNGPFDTTNGSAIITVNHVTHGLQDLAFVNFSGATAVAGLTISGNYQVRQIVNVNSYTIQHTSAANATVLGGGGAAVAYSYELAVGTDGDSGTSGWGIGTWGTPPAWDLPRPVSSDTPQSLTQKRIWSLDNWGEDLVACPRSAPTAGTEIRIYTWDRSVGTGTRAILVAPSPTFNTCIAVAQEQRILVSFGATDLLGVKDPMNVRWSNQEDFTTPSPSAWTPTFNNRAGGNRLTSGSRIITSKKTRREILIFTDLSVYSMQFIGGNDVFAFTNVGENVVIGGPNACAEINGIVYFMSAQDFWVYDGVIRILPCDVRESVFGDDTATRIDTSKLENTYCYINSQYNEVWWIYTSVASSSQNDRYAVYNFKENCWYLGSIDRTAMHGYSPVFKLPYGIRADSLFFTHEDSMNDANAAGTAISLDSSIESYDIELGTGDSFMHVSRLLPDFPSMVGAGTVTLKGRRYPDSSVQKTKGPYTVNPTDENINVRIRDRQISMEWEQTGLNTTWRMAPWRAGAREHGKR